MNALVIVFSDALYRIKHIIFQSTFFITSILIVLISNICIISTTMLIFLLSTKLSTRNICRWFPSLYPGYICCCEILCL